MSVSRISLAVFGSAIATWGAVPAVSVVPLRTQQNADILLAAVDTVGDAAPDMSDITRLYDNFAMAPFVSLQQAIVNLTSPDGLSDIGTNLRALLAGLTLEGGSTTHTASGETVSEAVLPHTLDQVHQALYNVLNNAADNDVFTDSFLNSVVPEAMWYAASPLWSMIYGEAGLLTPGITTGATDTDGTPVSDSTGVLPAGGSVLNSVGVTFAHPDELPDGLHTALDGASAISGVGVGPFGAVESWNQAMASILGWDGVGPPIDGFDLPLADAGSTAGDALTAF